MKIAIIGAGAAGMMTMATLVEKGISGKDILFFDGNDRMGRKVAITGGGRCNVTTGITRKKELLPKYIRGAEFLEDTMGNFSPKKCREWFELHDIPLKEEENYRIFPVSDKGWDIVRPFEKIALNSEVEMHLREKVISVSKTATGFMIQTEGNSYEVTYCVITTGGNAYTKTGSSGDGYSMATSLGHTVTLLRPSLSSFLTREEWGHEISGTVLENAGISAVLPSDWNKVISISGPLLFTHFGISGPVVFAASAHLAFEEISPKRVCTVRINADATKTREVWEYEVIAIFKKHPTKTLRNILPFFVPRRYAEMLSMQLGAMSDKTATILSKEDRKRIVELLFAMPITLIERRPWDEFVTAGGVMTNEINTQTMESRICPGLYFAGEVLNIDAVTGGFNLQACWATGRVAGESIARMCSIKK